MKGKIPEKLYKAVGGDSTWKHYGVSNREFGWKKFVEIDLEEITKKRLERLRDMIEPYSTIRGAKTLLRDINTWLRVLGKEKTGITARTVEQFAEILTAYINGSHNHWIFEHDDHSETWFAYYVEDIQYHPPEHHGGRRGNEYVPPSVSIDLFWIEFGQRKSRTISFHAEDCVDLSVTSALKRKGYVIASPALIALYERDVARFELLVDKIGLQLRGRGRATDDLDGNGEKDRFSSYSKKTLILDHDGNLAHLVVDVFRETDKDENENSKHIDLWFWKRKSLVLGTSDEDGENAELDNELDDGESVEETKKATMTIGLYEPKIVDESMKDEDGDPLEKQEDREELDEEDADPDRPTVAIPIHPMLATFDLRRHLRLRVHVAAVQVYEYDTKLASKLVLPQETTELVDMLVSSRGLFQDIVAGKSGGSIILCAGPPGVGKTLTAEVYSESKGRPLYSVQCSQLGLTPDELESELHKIFARAQRWGAILLLDEADVYVAKRGTDLQQNAIVGVFLRVLEYYSGILFLTTNRSDSVDDAIASRCVARIDYEIPSIDEQRRIWRIISDVSGVSISDKVIEEILATHNRLSGRDIKNLVKLAGLVSASRGTTITCATIDFVKRFKPTADLKEKYRSVGAYAIAD